MTNLEMLVTRKQRVADGICSYELTALDGEVLPAFEAGAHIDVHVAPGLVRQYSLCNDPAQRDQYRIAVLRESASRGGSSGMHDHVAEGQKLTVSQPKNHFPLVPAQRVLLLAGGIGITPLLAMAYALHGQGTPFELHYSCRSDSLVAFRDELHGAAFAEAVHVHRDDAPAPQRLDINQLLAAPESGTHVYVCGPKGYIDHVLEAARAHQWPESQLHREYFGADLPSHEADTSFDVELASTGQRLSVPAGKTVLEVLLAHDVDVPYSCESGVCGTCLTTVLSGTPDHQDSYLTDKERAAGNQFMPCCSRSKSPVLILDL